jgi:hypothetical protein
LDCCSSRLERHSSSSSPLHHQVRLSLTVAQCCIGLVQFTAM